MKLFTLDQEHRLLANGKANAEGIRIDGNTIDRFPVVKLFCPFGTATWLLSEIDLENPDIAFGLCDLGMGSPEIGSVSIGELAANRGPLGLRIERDLHFKGDKSLQAYAAEARSALGSLPERLRAAHIA